MELQCSLDATDEPISDDAGDFCEETEPTAQRGLGTNPKFSEKKIERSLNYYRYSRTTTGTLIKRG